MQPVTYIDNCIKTYGKVQRWPDNVMPILFYIAPFRWYKAQNEEFTYRQMVFDALNIWTAASGGRVSFKVVPTLNESQINLDWRRVDRASLGHCNTSYDKSGRIYSAEIQIGLSDGVLHSKYESKDEVFHTIVHEIGHSVGLGHSPFREDLMFIPHQFGVINVTERDKNTLKWLYKLPCGATSAEIAAQYGKPSEMSTDYIISQIESKGNMPIESEFSKQLRPPPPSKDLLDEQKVLADLNMYRLSIQNISVSPNIQNYVKKVMVDKNFKGNDQL